MGRVKDFRRKRISARFQKTFYCRIGLAIIVTLEVLDILKDDQTRLLCVNESKDIVEKVAPVVAEAFSQACYAKTLAGESSKNNIKVRQRRRVDRPYVSRRQKTVIGLVYSANAIVYVAGKDTLKVAMFLEGLVEGS